MFVRELCEVFTPHSFPVNDNRHQFVSISWVWNFHEDEWSVSHQISSVPCTTVLGSFQSSAFLECISPVLSMNIEVAVLFQSKLSLLGEHISIIYCRLVHFYRCLLSLIKWNINQIAFFYSSVFAKLMLFTFSKNRKGCIELIFFCMYDFTHFSVNVTWVDLGQIGVNLLYWKWTLGSLHSGSCLFKKPPWLWCSLVDLICNIEHHFRMREVLCE